MNYLYSELPEVVYNPGDIKGESPNQTIQLEIDNKNRIIKADVLKIPGILKISDLNTNQSYLFDGSSDLNVDIPKFEDSIKIELAHVTLEDLRNDLFPIDTKIGSTYLKITTAYGEEKRVLIPTPIATNNIQTINSIKIYSYNNLPNINAKKGDIYLAYHPEGGSKTVLYEYDGIQFNPIGNIQKGVIYAVLDLGLLALATSPSTFYILRAELDRISNELSQQVSDVEAGVGTAVQNLKDDFDSKLVNVKESLEDFTASVEKDLRSDIDYLGDNIKQLNTQIEDNINNKISQINQTITNLQEQIEKDIESSISDIETSISNIQTNIQNNIQTQLNSLREEIDSVKSNEDDQKPDSIAELADLIAKLNAQVDDLKDNYTYTPLQLLSYTINDNSNADIYYEQGTSQSINVKFKTDREATRKLLNGQSLDTLTGTANYEYTISGYENISNNKSYTLIVGDQKGADTSKTINVKFIKPIYYGVSTNPNLSIFDTLTKRIQPTLNSIKVTSNENEYIYYVAPYECEFTVGGFTGGFELLNPDNSANQSQYIYRSTNNSLGTITVSISIK